MTITKRNPDAGGVGARKAVWLTTANSPENSPPPRVLQVRRLATQFGLTPLRASLIARLAFADGGRP